MSNCRIAEFLSLLEIKKIRDELGVSIFDLLIHGSNKVKTKSKTPIPSLKKPQAFEVFLIVSVSQSVFLLSSPPPLLELRGSSTSIFKHLHRSAIPSTILVYEAFV